MKIFIIYASAGAGHKKIAEAVREAAVSLYGEDSVSFIDLLDFTDPVFRFLYSTGYIFVISKLRYLWAVMFFLSDTKYLSLFNVKIRRFLNSIFCYRLLNFIKREQPDVVISTHFLVNELCSLLKGRKLIESKLISVVTDFGVHNFWLAENINLYVAASEKTKEILVSKGIKEDKIRVLGLPVRNQFQRQIDKEAAMNKLGIKEKGFTILIFTGGIGIGPIYKITKLFKDEINIIVICGDNKNLFNQLKELNYKKLIVLGWIDYVQEVMAVSDLVITKPGGSTISECLVMDLPMIFFSIVPGQEYANAKIISQYGFGFTLENSEKIKEKVLYLKNNPQEIEVIKNKIKEFRFKDSSNKVLDLINEK